MPLNRSIILALAMTAFAACDAQVDGDHKGQVLARLSGMVHNQRTLSTPDAEVAIVWENSAGSPDLIGGDSVDIEGVFPTMFRLALYTPPEPRLVNQAPDGGRVGVAYIIAGRPGTDYGHAESSDLLGFDPDHLLIYVPSDVVEGSIVGTLLHGAPRAGFHVYNVHHLTDEERDARDQCRLTLPEDVTFQEIYRVCGGQPFDDLLPAPADLETPLQVELVDDPDQLDFPNWT